MNKNAFVSKAVRSKRMVAPDGMIRAVGKLRDDPNRSLIDLLLELELISDEQAADLERMYREEGEELPARPPSGTTVEPSIRRGAPEPVDGARGVQVAEEGSVRSSRPADVAAEAVPAAAPAPEKVEQPPAPGGLRFADDDAQGEPRPGSGPAVPSTAPEAGSSPAKLSQSFRGPMEHPTSRGDGVAEAPQGPSPSEREARTGANFQRSGLRLAADQAPPRPRPAEKDLEDDAVLEAAGAGHAEGDAGRIESFQHLDEYLSYAHELGASDVHINAGYPPTLRKDGRLVTLPVAPLSDAETERLLFEVLSPERQAALRERLSLDFCYRDGGGRRYRTCMVRQRLGWDGAFRVIAARVPTFEELGLPPAVERLTDFHQGLVLITGPSGCGKSTTMATLVERINETSEDHIITIEDPIEYEFVPAKAHLTQREVGLHTKNFANALRAALREDPDVIMIGELRDLETTSLAIRAAETGHLVIATMHTTSAARTIDRILDVFPPDEQSQVRSMISESIVGIVCQQLVPRKDGEGRALALELMFNTPAVANLIRERRLFQMPSILMTGKKQGMMLLDNSLLALVREGVVDGEEAYYAADNKATFQQWAPKMEAGRGPTGDGADR